ncbi:uncharacterized protein O3C94_002029 isoform 1-T2 [Discoglossus pictus]
MKIAITFLLLGLAGSASSLVSSLDPVTNAASLANLAAKLLASCDRAWKPDSEKSNDQILKELTGVLNSLSDFLDGAADVLSCSEEELLDEMKLDAALKGPLIEGCKTGDWTGLTTTYGQSLQPVVSGIVQALLNRMNSLVPGFDASLNNALVQSGDTFDVGVLHSMLPSTLQEVIRSLDAAGLLTGPGAASLGGLLD